MTPGDVLKYALHLISVPKCVCCKERLDFPNYVFCPKCSAEYKENKARNCGICAKPLYDCDCTNHYLEAHFIKRLFKVFRYKQRDENRAANSLIYSLKRDNREDVLAFAADELCAAMSASVTSDEVIFTNVPRRRAAIVKYGIDHSADLARRIAKRLGKKYLPLLASKSKVEQKALRGADRLRNADFYVKRKLDLTGKTVIIVDDIVTTGASMASAAMLIRGLGAKKIWGAALATAYRDTDISKG